MFPHMLCIALRPRQTRLILKDLLNKRVAEGVASDRAQLDWAYEFPDQTGPDTQICRTGPARPD